MNVDVHLKPIQVHERLSYMNYLLMADESEEVIDAYINEGEMLAVYIGDQLAGVVLLLYWDEGVVELKNIAIVESYRGKGVGKKVVEKITTYSIQKGQRKIIVGTANSSIGNIAFYQKVGFRLRAIKKDFFLQYPDPIVEDGIRALDMLMFERQLTH